MYLKTCMEFEGHELDRDRVDVHVDTIYHLVHEPVPTFRPINTIIAP